MDSTLYSDFHHPGFTPKLLTQNATRLKGAPFANKDIERAAWMEHASGKGAKTWTVLCFFLVWKTRNECFLGGNFLECVEKPWNDGEDMLYCYDLVCIYIYTCLSRIIMCTYSSTQPIDVYIYTQRKVHAWFVTQAHHFCCFASWIEGL